MPRRQYRVTRPTLALFKSNEGHVARLLPNDARIAFDPDEVLARAIALIGVVFEGELVLMFASDLKSLAVPE